MEKTKTKLSLIYFVLLFTTHIQAQIITDGTVGAKTTLVGTDFLISQDLGTRVGNNLFHSFETFSINNQESAIFTGSSDITNVISRVTSGAISIQSVNSISLNNGLITTSTDGGNGGDISWGH
ncbi:MAG: hypothetical protein COB17_08090 [Sulfurimonas sp.]|nr:MAG: hypothetical protein COB17_08090 [Sulfurimonas sp.]